MERWREWKFFLGELQSLNGFVMLKATFRKTLISQISITCVYIKPEI